MVCSRMEKTTTAITTRMEITTIIVIIVNYINTIGEVEAV